MTLRTRFDVALDEWNRSVVALNAAIGDFMNDGLQTHGGTWILTMSQPKGDALQAALQRADRAKAALDRIIGIVRELGGDRLPNPMDSFQGPADGNDGLQ